MISYELYEREVRPNACDLGNVHERYVLLNFDGQIGSRPMDLREKGMHSNNIKYLLCSTQALCELSTLQFQLI